MEKLIERLSNANGAPGFEDEVVSLIKEELGSEFIINEDKMRNLIIKTKNYDPSLPTVMIDGHSDEVAFMVQNIQPNGTIKFLTLGGWMPENVAAIKVQILNNRGEWITGIVASKPPHFTTGDPKPPTISDFVIDVGAISGDEVIDDFGIEVGAPIVPFSTFEYQATTGIMLGKAFDNRLGCGCVIEVLRRVKDENLKVNVVGTISAQEEVGTRGAKVNVTNVKPDIAIIFEGTPADDTFRPAHESQGKLKGGTQIRHRDRSMIANPRLIKYAVDIAKDENIPYQRAVRVGGGTNAGPIHIEEHAIPSLILGTPVRYAHTSYGYSSMLDYQATIDLAISLIRKINADVIEAF